MVAGESQAQFLARTARAPTFSPLNLFISEAYARMNNVLAILLAGGAGERLYPLTRDTAKPAVPFGGHYQGSEEAFLLLEAG